MKAINKFIRDKEAFDRETDAKIVDKGIKDHNSKECKECGLKTDFIFSDDLCELCKKSLPEHTICVKCDFDFTLQAWFNYCPNCGNKIER